MAGDRFVVLGLARARAGWFREVARWATAASLPVDFVKCVSREELAARLTSNRPFSAVLVDGGLPAVDRDLLDAARAAGCAVLVVDDGRVERDWLALGASGVLLAGFGRDELLDALRHHAVPVGLVDAMPGPVPEPPGEGWRGRLVAVTGAGGTGTSTAAIGLAQGFGDDARHGGLVLLADLALHAEQAMLHDARELVPGVPELVEAHRAGRPSSEEVRSLAFRVPTRRYHVLLGLRRHRDWAALRPRALEASIEALLRSWRVVVADVDADVEGEDDCGSADVEDRNCLARTTLTRADAVVVVGTSTMKGLHGLARLLNTLGAFGVAGHRLLPVINRAPRRPGQRAEVAAALDALLTHAGRPAAAGPVFLPDRRQIEDALRDGVRLPATHVEPLTAAVAAVLGSDAPPPDPAEPQPIRPGQLGHWET